MIRRRSSDQVPVAGADKPLLSILEMENKIADRRSQLERSEQQVVEARAAAEQLLAQARRDAADAAGQRRKALIEQAEAEAERRRGEAAEQARLILATAKQHRAADVARVLTAVLPTEQKTGSS